MIDHIPELMDAGLDSLKIEGRAKSAYYAAVVTAAYRHAIDAAASGLPLGPGVWRDEVEQCQPPSLRYRPFYFGQPGQYYENARYIREWQVIALVTDCGEDGMAALTLRNKFAVGDEVELVGPDLKPLAFTVPEMADGEGNPISEAKNAPRWCSVCALPCRAPAGSILRIARDLSAKS